MITTLVCALAAGPSAAAAPHWADIHDVPVERLIENLGRYVEENPNDPEGYYRLGRIYGLSFYLETKELGVFGRVGRSPLEDGRFPWLAPDVLQEEEYPRREGEAWLTHLRHGQRDPQLKPKTPSERPDPDLRREHLVKALLHTRKALELDQEPARYHLGLAYLLERGAHLAAQVSNLDALGLSTTELPEEEVWRIEVLIDALGNEPPERRQAAFEALSKWRERALPQLDRARSSGNALRSELVEKLLVEEWKSRARDAYWRAFELTPRLDVFWTITPRRLVIYEAGCGWLRLGTQDADEEEMQLRGEIRTMMERIAESPGAVTPVILSKQSVAEMEPLLAPHHRVLFDLDGDGLDEIRPWIQPTTALLGWDPEGTGVISSGRQLFGSVTWWMFFENGYRALDALDDDRDGWLRGDELEGLVLWYDADSDAISDPGEVRPVGTHGIRAIATDGEDRVENGFARDCGVEWVDGAALPSFDWVVGGLGTAVTRPN